MTNQKLELINENKFSRLGVIGGLGPETSFNFCLNVNNKVRELTDCQPDILLENLPVSKNSEEKIIRGIVAEELKWILISAVERLNKSGVDFIVIPCNTVHIFIDELRRISKVPILSIIEETAKECSKKGVKRAGLLASKTTINQKLHENELKKFGIETVSPDSAEQKTINDIIIRIIHNNEDSNDKKILADVIKKLKTRGADAVILGCTDLSSLISQKNSDLKLIDTLKILEKCSVEFFIETKNIASLEGLK